MTNELLKIIWNSLLSVEEKQVISNEIESLKKQTAEQKEYIKQLETRLENAIELPYIATYDNICIIKNNKTENYFFIEFAISRSHSEIPSRLYSYIVFSDGRNKDIININKINKTVFIGENAEEQAEQRLKELREEL